MSRVIDMINEEVHVVPKNKKSKDKTKRISKYTFYKRAFLNKGRKGTAFCEAEFNRAGYINETQKYVSLHSNSYISISDCSRIITLSFDFYDEKACQNSLHKVKKLAHIINEFGKQIEKEIEEFKRLKKLYPNKREKHT